MQQRLLALVTVLVPGLAYAQPTDAPPVDPATSDVVAEPPAPEAPPVDTQPAPEPAPPAADGHAISAKYDKGLTFETADGEYELKLGIRSQFRLEAARPDVAGTEFATRFSVPRLRLQLEGHAYGEANGYKVEFDMANKGFALLKDFFIDHAFAKDLHLRAGQAEFDVPVLVHAGIEQHPFLQLPPARHTGQEGQVLRQRQRAQHDAEAVLAVPDLVADGGGAAEPQCA